MTGDWNGLFLQARSDDLSLNIKKTTFSHLSPFPMPIFKTLGIISLEIKRKGKALTTSLFIMSEC